ncbi:MAG TPA: adenylate/guanylate cyclase domain-containing protein [Gemmatimonadales bacterium]|nr:adenylate/guanylate cyclase domain-containing protein [Gemmatimonadales bacterium]
MDARVGTGLRYATGLPAGAALVDLVANSGTADEQRVPFASMLEIGRDEEGRQPFPGLLLVTDPAVSRRHCLIARSADGRWYVRDVSRNGTRVAGRRLVPNVETEIIPGETLTVGSLEFTFEIRAAASRPIPCTCERETDAAPTQTIATVLVGDIRDYTVLVRRVPSPALQRSVSRVFEILTSEVGKLGGTVKEYPGDAVLAFWEGGPDGTQTSVACRAALELDRLAHRMAADPTVWEVADFPLLMDWALATGPVLIHTFGGAHPQGLSLVGEPVVLAFRLEKLAGDDTGPILTCGRTRALAGAGFAFRDLGEIAPKGFHQRSHVYALLAESDQVTARIPAVSPSP